MSDWEVHLEFEEGSSSKFWRARIDGGTLYVNYGKIGTNGQTQVKDLGPEGARKELDKLVREKRKKGYVDAGAGGGDEDAADDEAEDDDEAGDDDAVADPSGASARFALRRGGRQVTSQLTLSGSTVRLDAVETHATPAEARKAYDRLRAALASDGHEPS